MPVMFIDESKHPNYLFAAILVSESDIPRLRKALRNSLIAGQRSIHFQKEQDARRRKLLTVFKRHGFHAVIFQSVEKFELDARFDCLEKVVGFAVKNKVSRLVFERDDSIYKFDEASLYSLIRRIARQGTLGFEHFYRHEEPLLWVADSVAWCANHSGDWNRRVQALILKTES